MAKGVFKYDWTAIQQYYDEGHGYLECRQRFGFAKDTWIKAINNGRIIVRPRRWPLEKILALSKSRFTIKRRLIEAGILQNICDECGLSEWRGRPLSIQVDHLNGINNDHRLANLRMLCHNCHSQTATYASRNRKTSWGRKNEAARLMFGRTMPELGAQVLEDGTISICNRQRASDSIA